MTRRITLREIGLEAGVSTTTVSNVLNGKEEHVSEQTAVRIREIAQKLGYDSESLARRAVRKPTMTLGMIVPSFTSHLHAQAMTGAEATAGRFGYQIIAASNVEGETQEVKTVESFLSRRVDGIIFCSSSRYVQSDSLRRAADARIPCVVINRIIDPKLAYHIEIDNEETSYQATRHLIRLGHTRIGAIHFPIEGPMVSKLYVMRYQGYRRALTDHGLPFDPAWSREGPLGDEPGAAAIASSLTQEILAGPDAPTALVCSSDTLAVGAMRAAQSLGIAIPDKLAVVGFDDTPTAAHLTPPLTSVRQPSLTAGSRAVEVIVQAIWKGSLPTGLETMACELIVRGSTTPY